jgi:hypothetical protein
MLVDTPLMLFFLTPTLVSFVVYAMSSESHRWVKWGAISAVIATIISVAEGVVSDGYSPTGTTLAAGFTFVQYLPICIVIVALLAWAGRKFRRKC